MRLALEGRQVSIVRERPGRAIPVRTSRIDEALLLRVGGGAKLEDQTPSALMSVLECGRCLSFFSILRLFLGWDQAERPPKAHCRLGEAAKNWLHASFRGTSSAQLSLSLSSSYFLKSP